jgi:hypothetical protein
MCCNSFSAHISNISSRIGIVCFAVLLLKSTEIYMKAFWHSTWASLFKSWLPRIRWGKRKWNVYLNSKNIFIGASVTQESDVAHGPLVNFYNRISDPRTKCQCQSPIYKRYTEPKWSCKQALIMFVSSVCLHGLNVLLFIAMLFGWVFFIS